LFALRPERVSVVPGPDGWPAAYAYKIGDRALTIPVEVEDGWPGLIHLKFFHPADDHYGAGCLGAADQAVAIHNAAAAWNRAWTRRARGAWGWPDEVELPLGEHSEAYRVGLGPVEAPLLFWDVATPSLALDAPSVAAFESEYSGEDLWVRQIGSHAQSDPLLLTTLP
jgi:hypothetical protein